MITAGEIGLPEQSTSSGISLRGRTVPGYIAVEGPIGVGKTTLARRIAASIDAWWVSATPSKTYAPLLPKLHPLKLLSYFRVSPARGRKSLPA